MKRAAFTASALACTLLVAPAARAGFEDSLGVGADAMALGGSYAARPGTFASAYYNPAGLAPGGAVVEHGGFFELSIGAVYAHPELHATSASGVELFRPEIDGSQRPVEDTAGVLVGTRFSVGQPFHVDGLDFGLAVFVPGHLFNWADRPDDDVQWELLEDRTQVISAHAGLAYRVTRWLSLGVGVRVLFNTQTDTNGEVTSVGLEQLNGKTVVRTHTQLGTDAQVYGQAYPILGALFTPVDHVRFGLVYRQSSYVNDWGTTRINGVPDLGTIGYSSHFAHYFEPTELTLATSFDLGDRLDLSADFTYARWSEALSNNLNFWGPGRWGDTGTFAFGARVRATRALGVMAGYRYQPSPLDNFGGPSNMLDCDRHVASMGLDLHLGKLVGKPTFDAHVTMGLQYTVLVDRTEVKDYRRFTSDQAWMSNPGYPSYTYGGHMVAGQLALEARW
jgi:long-subunit fatty acid transport protein